MANSRDKIVQQKKKLMLAAIAESGNIGKAAAAAGISRNCHYNWMQADKAYAKAVDEAFDDAVDLLETEAKRRAYEGVEEPVYQGGKQVGTIRKYSDTLLIFLMKGARPEKYRDRQQIEQTVSGSVTLNVVIPGEKE